MRNTLKVVKHGISENEPHVATISALHDVGIDGFLDELAAMHKSKLRSGELAKVRVKNRSALFNFLLEQILFERMRHLSFIEEKCAKVLQNCSANAPLTPAINVLVDEICDRLR